MSTPASPFADSTVAIVGVGLIGGSLAAAIKHRRVARRVIGVGRSTARLQSAKAARLIDDFSMDLAQAARESQLVIVCTPVDRIVADVRAAATAMQDGGLITDAGSVKGGICDSLCDLAHGPVTFVGSHPLAGSEKQGFEHASATLFEQKVCVITPPAGTLREPLERLHQFWQAVGMQTCELSPAEHDTTLARTSHLPHAVAAALAATLRPEHTRFAANGFRDTTRIAGGDPELWTAIFQQNSAALVDSISRMEEQLATLKQLLLRGEAASLQNWLQIAKTNRDQLDDRSP